MRSTSKIEPLVKGTHILVARDYVDETMGKGTFAKLTESGGKRWQVLLPSSWYELDVLHPALVTVAVAKKRKIIDVATDIASRNARTDLTGVYKLFLKMLSPQTVLGKLPHLWRLYVQFGECFPVSNDKGRYVAEGRGLIAEYSDWAAGCWRGFITTAVEMSGGHRIEVSLSPLKPEADGARFRFEIRYA
ncbi:MAG: hypothetical protein JWN44_1857 [Myxococcales bacterium]|nr:hypothetical protein [Myxococcales bacterium]